MELNTYFEPVNINTVYPERKKVIKRMGDAFHIYQEEGQFPELNKCDIAILGVKEDRNAVDNKGCGEAPDEIRKKLYLLYSPQPNIRIVDLGNIIPASTPEDTYFAVSEVVAELLKHRIIPIILGGGQDLSWANYKAYEKIGQIINLFCVDSRLDIGDAEEQLNSRSYLSRMLLSQPNYLFNYTNIGYQSYFVDPDAVQLMDQLYFDTYRLGVVKENMKSVEPLVRNADMVSIDISSVRQSDAPGNNNSSPHGFYGEDLCLITHFAGMSDKTTSIGFYEYTPALDNHGQTAHLIAHAIWYFIRGFYNRKHDYPYKEKHSYKKYIVPLKNESLDIIFYKSKKSDRWWMEIPCNEELKNRYERHFMVPCTYADYEQALEDEIPERFWRFYQKLMA